MYIGAKSCVQVESQTALPQQLLILEKAFEFDHAFAPEVSQAQVYAHTASPLLAKFFAGFNATVFCYGQTGSGKTYTMGSTLSGGKEEEEEESGILPRLFKDVFARMAEEEEQDFRLQLSYLEIYKEECIDLLAPSSSSSSLSIREDGNGIQVAGLSLHEASSLSTVHDLLYRGALARSTASTNMNSHSSRSHAIVTLHLESWPKGQKGRWVGGWVGGWVGW